MKTPLWTPSAERVNTSQMQIFKERLGVVGDYQALHDFSVRNSTEFWSALWDFCRVRGFKGEQVLTQPKAMPGAKWFPEASLNFAENLLAFDDEQIAVAAYLENGKKTSLSYATLNLQVRSLAGWLLQAGVKPGDRVAALLPNIPQTIVTMLASASIGATFSSCSPDFGASGVLDRFGQITPRILVTCDGYFYNGKGINIGDRVKEIVSNVTSIKQVVLVSILDDEALNKDAAVINNYSNCTVTDFKQAIQYTHNDFVFEQLPFDHPLYIMYSSGTTGTPKCIVHGAGGTLLQHLKEHRLHVNLKRTDVLFYFTTCGWMMWNWLVSGLASGATIVLYDGSPFYPSPNAMMDLAERERVSVFGTSAKYLASLEKADIKPINSHDLSALHTILSTGSPLSHESFEYVYRDVKKDVCLSSISGGTDIISCFVLGNPTLPVYAGELQCAGLGMDVKIYDDQGESVKEAKGELVCVSPFPAMPIGFWQDDGTKYHRAYFERFENVWAQGDYGEITAQGGFIIHGRSDAVLNPGGVRIGTAEIYRQVERIDEVMDSVCIGQQWQDDVRVILFVVLTTDVRLDEALIKKIKLGIRENTTPRHVPARVISVPEIPRTISGKVVELAVRKIIHGETVNNKDALANPEALDAFIGILDGE